MMNPRELIYSLIRGKKAGDPHISVLRRFAKAMAISIEELIGEKRRK
jgi:hypothetical protein